MAYENTHLWAADTVRNQIENTILGEIINGSIDYYYLGSVFPDTLSFSQSKKIKNISILLHGETETPVNQVIFDMLDLVKRSRDKNNFAFICGLLTHCAMDIVLHPMVVYFSGFNPTASPSEASKASYLHWHFETYIDQRFNNEFYLDKIIRPTAVQNLVAVPVLRISEQNLLDCLKIQISYFKRTHSRILYMVYRMMNKIGLVKGKYLAGFYANLEVDRRILPEEIRYRDIISGENKEDTLSGLMDQAIERGVQMVTSAYDYYCNKISRQICESIVTAKSLDTGQIGKTLSDVRYSIGNSS